MHTQPAVLWDLDGTLIDSLDYHWQAWQETVAKEGYTLSKERFVASFGQRSETAIYNYCSNDLSLDEARRIVDAKQQRYRELVREHGVVLLPGASEWLQQLKSLGWRQALATSASILDAEVILAVTNLTDLFDAVVGAESVQKSKPDPEVFLFAAHKLGVPTHRCIVVEDSPVGIQAAQAAQMQAIGVLTSHQNLTADYLVKSLSDLNLGIFQQLLEKAAQSN